MKLSRHQVIGSGPLAESPLIAIAGPTASGKSALAVWLARQLGGEVVACDSTQLYRGFDVGTAKPRLDQDFAAFFGRGGPSTAGSPLRGLSPTAVAVLEDLREAAGPIFTGTGLYRARCSKGLPMCRCVRKVAERRGQRSRRINRGICIASEEDGSGLGERIAPGDKQKLIRAVEVCLLAKKPLSEVHRAGRNPLRGWRPIKIGLSPEREALYQRIHARTDAMLAAGWMEEVRGLVAGNLPSNAKPFDFIGYRELRAVLNGEMKLEEAKAAIQQATRRYGKRQLTWFRRDAQIHWLSGFGQKPQFNKEALAIASSQSLNEFQR
jgi:tRNA dimethylallyltransferase